MLETYLFMGTMVFCILWIFHLHRIWALIDRETYASFWMRIMENKGLPYFLIMGILAGLCIVGIITFFCERKANYATEMLRYALSVCKQKGMDRVILGCYKDNLASAATIKKNGGQIIGDFKDLKYIIRIPLE